MNTLSRSLLPLSLLAFLSASAHADPAAMKHIQRMDQHLNGKSFTATFDMQVTNAQGSRTMKAKVWNQGRKSALVKILEPSKDRNSGNLRLGLELWQYLTNVDRIIKIPASLMLQSWMGSDFSNDDLVRGSSLVLDYNHALTGAPEDWKGMRSVKITCTPKPDAPVVWGKVVARVREKDSVPLQQEFYSEKGELLKVLEGEKIQTFGSHTIPTLLTMKTLKKNSTTTIQYSNVTFDAPIPASIFTQQYLKKPVQN